MQNGPWRKQSSGTGTDSRSSSSFGQPQELLCACIVARPEAHIRWLAGLSAYMQGVMVHPKCHCYRRGLDERFVNRSAGKAIHHQIATSGPNFCLQHPAPPIVYLIQPTYCSSPETRRINLQTRPNQSLARGFNAAKMVSIPLLAIS